MFPAKAHNKTCKPSVRILKEHFCLSTVCCRLLEIAMFWDSPRQSCVLCAALLEIPVTSLGPINSAAAACLARSSAVSLPGKLQWSSIHTSDAPSKHFSFILCSNKSALTPNHGNICLHYYRLTGLLATLTLRPFLKTFPAMPTHRNICDKFQWNSSTK